MINLIENIKYYFIIGSRKLRLWFQSLKKLSFRQYMLITLSVMGAAFLFSLALFFVDKGFAVRRVLFFPDAFTNKLRGEERYIKREPIASGNIKRLIEELLLGPVTPDMIRVVPQKTRLISLILKNNNLSLNLSEGLIIDSGSLPFTFEKSILSCINTIRFNFPELKKIDFFIHGEELVLEFQDKHGEKIPLENVGFSPDLLQ